MRTPLYTAWVNMRQRCDNPKHPQFKDWGGRGIKVCLRWRHYAAFASDMGPHPGKGWTLDRIDNNSGYNSGNCRWATHKTQHRNTRTIQVTPCVAAYIRKHYMLGVNRWHRGNVAELARKFGLR